jgi:hypothetical protein
MYSPVFIGEIVPSLTNGSDFMNSILSKIAMTAVICVGFAGVANAQAVTMRAGEGNKLNLNFVADNAWNELGRVGIRPKATGVCVVTATGHTEAHGQNMSYTLATRPAQNTVPWEQVNWDKAENWRDWAMSQAFNVRRGKVYRFFINARSHQGDGTTTVENQLTRIWVVCSKGGKVQSSQAAEGKSGGRNTPN